VERNLFCLSVCFWAPPSTFPRNLILRFIRGSPAVQGNLRLRPRMPRRRGSVRGLRRALCLRRLSGTNRQTCGNGLKRRWRRRAEGKAICGPPLYFLNPSLFFLKLPLIQQALEDCLDRLPFSVYPEPPIIIAPGEGRLIQIRALGKGGNMYPQDETSVFSQTPMHNTRRVNPPAVTLSVSSLFPRI